MIQHVHVHIPYNSAVTVDNSYLFFSWSSLNIHRCMNFTVIKQYLLPGHPSSKLHNCFSYSHCWEHFFPNVGFFTHVAAIYPVIANGTFFKKIFKRLKRKVCIFISFHQKANSSHLHELNHSDWHCICCSSISNYNATCSCVHMQEH